MNELIRNVTIKRVDISKGMIEEVEDEIAVEVMVDIYVDGRHLRSVYTTPHMLLELGLGYAYTQGFSVKENDIVIKGFSIELYNVVKRELCSDVGCGIKVSLTKVYEVFRQAIDRAELFRRTGCFHFASIATFDGILLDIVEDVARHCALYKVIGRAIRMGVDLSKSMILMSSRASAELVKGIVNSCIPVAVFRGAPTFKAIEIAENYGLVLIAHVRDSRMNIYTGFEFITS